jgi:hypothetical protein
METFLQSGGRKSSRWKRSSKLGEENHRDGNVPQIWGKKIIAIETSLQSGGRKSSCFCGEIPSLPSLKIKVVLLIGKRTTAVFVRNFQFSIRQFSINKAIIWRKPILIRKGVSRVKQLKYRT